ncbi:MAG: hypothetical protein IKX58_00850, partial [Clostridia bacterium]|nr:hypothetical protein [Clostridia bacterium]
QDVGVVFLYFAYVFSTFDTKSFWLHAPDLPCVRGGGLEGFSPTRRKGCYPFSYLSFLAAFQPLSHPRVARLTAPLGNGSRGFRSSLECFPLPHLAFFELIYDPSVILTLFG